MFRSIRWVIFWNLTWRCWKSFSRLSHSWRTAVSLEDIWVFFKWHRDEGEEQPGKFRWLFWMRCQFRIISKGWFPPKVVLDQPASVNAIDVCGLCLWLEMNFDCYKYADLWDICVWHIQHVIRLLYICLKFDIQSVWFYHFVQNNLWHSQLSNVNYDVYLIMKNNPNVKCT